MAVRRAAARSLSKFLGTSRASTVLAGPSNQLIQTLLPPSGSRSNWRSQNATGPFTVFKSRDLAKFVDPDDIRDSRVWTAREYTPEFRTSVFTNNKSLAYKSKNFANKGATLQWWAKKGSQYHVTKFYKEQAARNGGFGFHISSTTKKKVRYFFNRDGVWVDTAPGNPRIKPPAKVQAIANHFAAMQRTYKRSTPSSSNSVTRNGKS